MVGSTPNLPAHPHSQGADPARLIARACAHTFAITNDGVNLGTCGHGGGHGLYYFYGDMQAALPACSRGALGEWGEWWAANCRGGVFHSAFNTYSVPTLRAMIAAGASDVAHMCEQSARAHGGRAADALWAECPEVSASAQPRRPP